MIILLILLTSIILSILIAEKLLDNFKRNINSRPLQLHQSVIENENYKNYYRPKRYVITLNEL